MTRQNRAQIELSCCSGRGDLLVRVELHNGEDTELPQSASLHFFTLASAIDNFVEQLMAVDAETATVATLS